MIYSFLFPTKSNTTKVSLLLLAVRIIFGILLMNHGIQKWSNFQEMSAVFPDPLGIGSPLSLGLAIFGELVCSMAFIVGFLYRLAMIPMIFTMIVAFFVVHANDVFAVKELASFSMIFFNSFCIFFTVIVSATSSLTTSRSAIKFTNEINFTVRI